MSQQHKEYDAGHLATETGEAFKDLWHRGLRAKPKQRQIPKSLPSERRWYIYLDLTKGTEDEAHHVHNVVHHRYEQPGVMVTGGVAYGPGRLVPTEQSDLTEGRRTSTSSDDSMSSLAEVTSATSTTSSHSIAPDHAPKSAHKQARYNAAKGTSPEELAAMQRGAAVRHNADLRKGENEGGYYRDKYVGFDTDVKNVERGGGQYRW
jgi:hypothetical protein